MDPALLSLSRFAGGLHASRTSLLGDEPTAVPAKLAASLRGPVADISTSNLSTAPTAASFIGSGISDLRATVAAQQRQLDGLVDKTAAVLAAMHAEVCQSVQSQCHRDMGEVNRRIDEELSRVGVGLEGRFAELKDTFLGETRVIEERVSSGLRDDVRGRMSNDMEGVQERLTGLHHHVASELHGLHGLHSSLMGEMQGVLQRVEGLECQAQDEAPAWELAIEHSVAQLRRELLGDASHGAAPLVVRVRALEEQLCSAPPERAQHRGLLDSLEASLRRHSAAIHRLEGENRELRRAAATSLEAGAQAAEWRQRVEERLEAAVSSETRVGSMESWRKRTEERLERLLCEFQPLRDRLGSAEHRLDAACERMDALSARYGGAAGGSHAGGSWRRLGGAHDSAGHHMDELDERLEALAAAVKEEARRMAQNARDIESLGARVEGTEKAVEAAHRQVVELRGEQRTLARERPRVPQMQGALQELTDQIRVELESQMAQAQSASQQLAAELREDLEGRISQVQSASQRLGKELREELEEYGSRPKRELRAVHLESSSEQPITDELRKDMELRTAQVYNSAQKLTDEMRRLRQELEERVTQTQEQLKSQVRQDIEAALLSRPSASRDAADDHDARLERARQADGGAQRLVSELRHDMEARVSEVRSSMQRSADELRHSLRDVSSLRVGLDGVKAFAEETQRQLADFRATRLQGAGESIAVVAREAAAEAVEALTVDLEAGFAERFARCDKAALGCERCVRAVEERLRSVTEDLKRQLLPDGCQPFELVNAALQIESRTPSKSPHRGPPCGLGLDASSSSAAGPDFDMQATPSGVTVLENLSRRLERLERHGGSAEETRLLATTLKGDLEGYSLQDKVTGSLRGLEQPEGNLKE